jgi:hypothetical protein
MFWVFNGFLAKTSTYDYKAWDVRTVTAADYTAEWIITDEIWDNYRNQSGENRGDAKPSLRKF